MEPLIHDRYRELGVLGRGASAETLLCEDTQTGIEVAVKVLLTERLESWKHFDLFSREAKVLGQLRHHGIPELFDFFELNDKAEGRPRLYLVQEFVEGRSLASIIADGPRLGRAEVQQIAFGLLDILDYLHTRNPPIYHRDIKPSNIIVRPSGAPVLIDFGGVRDGWRPKNEGGSTVVGTHGYMPSEQYVGQISPASDLYALGATLLHLVTGRAPADFSFDSGRIEVPADLPTDNAMRALIAASLEPAPRDRPQSAVYARALLVAEAEPVAVPREHALVPTKAGSTALALRLDEAMPQFVEMGAPGRDPNGPFAGVYRNLHPSHFRVVAVTGGKPGRDTSAVDVGFYFLMTLFTIGIWPLVAMGYQRSRKSKCKGLFEEGLFTQGTLVSNSGSDGGGRMLVYDFEANGQRHRGTMTTWDRTTRYFAIGDPVSVLYDPQDPSRSCIVYQ